MPGVSRPGKTRWQNVDVCFCARPWRLAMQSLRRFAKVSHVRVCFTRQEGEAMLLFQRIVSDNQHDLYSMIMLDIYAHMRVVHVAWRQRFPSTIQATTRCLDGSKK